MAAVTAGAAGAERRRLLAGAADALLGGVATAAGWVTGRALRTLPLAPAVYAAGAVSVGSGFFASHVFGHGLAPWVALTVSGIFALRLDWRI